jgi:hypothetical protein
MAWIFFLGYKIFDQLALTYESLTKGLVYKILLFLDLIINYNNNILKSSFPYRQKKIKF